MRPTVRHPIGRAGPILSTLTSVLRIATGSLQRFLIAGFAASIPLVVLLTENSADRAYAQTMQTEPASDDFLILNFQNADIRSLISTVSEVTGKNFIIDPRVSGNVTVMSGSRLPLADIYEVFLSILDVYDLAAVPSGDVTKIMPVDLAKQASTPTVAGIPGALTDAHITQVYQLQHGSVLELVPVIRPLLRPSSHFAAHASTNTLVFTDTARNVDRVLEVVRSLDQPRQQINVNVLRLRHADADSVAQTLTNLAATLQPRGPEGAVLVRPISVQAVEDTNTLIIQAPDAELAIMREVISQLDVPETEEGKIHVVYLKHAKASELVELLQQTVSVTGDPESATPSDLSVAADEGTNALVIRADERKFADLRRVIDGLDLRRQQVFVETIIAEVSYDKAAELGVEWDNLQRTPHGSQIEASQTFSEPATTGLRIGVIHRLISTITGDIVPDLEVVLRALRSDSNTNVLSTPNLLTLENETAEIVVAQEVPFVTGQFISTASTTGVVDGGDGDGDTAGIVNPFQTIERKDVGLTLRITPQINEGGTIRLDLEQEVSNVSQRVIQDASDLITDKRAIRASVQVDDGQIIVLGGLIRDDLQDTIEWVPILGELPFVGAFFRKTTKTARKTNLMVFLRPTIIRSSSDLAKETESKYSDVQEAQESSQPRSRDLIPEADNPVLPDIWWGK